jgi:hypothetical protein
MAYVWQRWMADEYRKAGLKVVEVSGWKNRGRPASTGNFDPRGAETNHHTGTQTSASRKMPTLRTLIEGRPDLPGPLSQKGIGYDGTVYVIAAGRSNHAGKVGKRGVTGMPLGADGNAIALGNEVDTNGTQTLPKAQRDALAKVNAVDLLHFKRGTSYLHRHQDISGTGKWDIGNLTTAQVRADATSAIKTLTTPPAPKPEVPAMTWTTPIDKDPRAVAGAVTLQTATANVCELPRHDATIAATFKTAASGCQLVGFQETGNPVYVRKMQDTLVNHSCSGIMGDPQHNVSIAFDKAMFKRVGAGWRKLYDGEEGISHTRHALWVEIESLLDPSFRLVLLSAHYPAGAFDPDGTPRDSGDRIPKRVAMWNEANAAMLKLLEELATKGHPMVLFGDFNRQKVRALPATVAGHKTSAISNALDWTFYIDGPESEWETHEVNKVDINSPGHPALQNRATLTRG